jgi:prephenate dehydrogenase
MTQIGLIGFGRFGRAFAQLLEAADVPYLAFDPFADVPANVRGASLADLAARCTTIMVGVPVGRMRETLESLAPHLSAAHTVFDVGSVKLNPTEAMAETLGDRVPWVATHPLFGPMSLALAERPLRVVLCPNPLHPGAVTTICNLYRSIGCEVVTQTAEEHDRVMAHTHALTFFVAKGMMDAGAGLEVPFAPPSFQAIARTIEAVRSDAGHLFVAIQNENPFASEARKQLVDALANINQMLATPSVSQFPPPLEIRIPDLGNRSPELKEAREHIDALDRELMVLLRRRAELAERALRAKEQLGAPVLDAQREAELFSRRRVWAAELGLEADGVEEVFRAVVRFSRRMQSKARQ